jgi:DNA polymerase-1
MDGHVMTDSSIAAAAPGSGKPSLFVVDAFNFLFRAFHALPPLATSQGVQTGAVYGLCQMLLKIEREHQPTHLCVVFDSPGDNFRHRLFPAYKLDRPAMPPELARQMELVHRVIDAFGIQTLVVAGFEADDIIATVARLAVTAGMRVVICSSDKDLMQLCCDDINVLDTMKNRMLGPAEVLEKFGVPADRVGDVLALTGDSIDNVPGIAGIGPKTAAELINRYGSLAALIDHVGEIKGKRGEALLAGREAVLLSRELVRLREDVPLPKSLSALHRIDPDRDRLRQLFRDLEFTRLEAGLASSPAVDAGNAGNAGNAGSASETPAAADAQPGAPATDAEAPGPTRPLEIPIDPELLLDPDAVTTLAEALRESGGFGLSALWDGPSAVRAEIVGLAFALANGRRVYLPLGHRYLGAPPSVRVADALARLAPILEDETIKKRLHDAKTVEVLLRRAGVVLRGVDGDSMLAAYLLDASRTRYEVDIVATASGIADVVARSAWLGSGKGTRAASDATVDEAGRRLAAEAAAALALATRQAGPLIARGLDNLYRDLELPLARVLAKVECRGIRLDSDALRALGQEVGASLLRLETEIHALAGTTFNINSNKQLGEVLFDKLALPVVRKTKTGASTDSDTLEELAALHPVPAKVVEYRTLAKLKGTYIDALPALVDPNTGRLHTSFNQAVAATGRLSSSDPNLQNIPIRTELGGRIRQAFLAKAGTRLVSADYSQIELRVLAHFSQDPAFLEAFRSGEDIHLRTAAEVFGLPAAAVGAEHRRIAKAINFGLVFGQTDFGLAQTLRIPRAQARAYIENYFRRYSGVKAYMDRAIAEARATGEVMTLLGRRRPLPEIRSSRGQDRSYAERIARNSPIQGTAADLLKLAMIRIDRGIEAGDAAGAGAELLLTVHDELVFEVPAERVPAFSEWVKREMESVFALDVPLVVDVGAGQTWGDAHH